MPVEKVSAILKTEDVSGTMEWYRRIGFRVRGFFPKQGNPRSANSLATA
jgi:hypothetical protein